MTPEQKAWLDRGFRRLLSDDDHLSVGRRTGLALLSHIDKLEETNIRLNAGIDAANATADRLTSETLRLQLLRAKLEAERDKLRKLDEEAATHVETVICMRTGFTGEPPYVGWKGLGLALTEALDERDSLRADLERAREAFNAPLGPTFYCWVVEDSKTGKPQILWTPDEARQNPAARALCLWSEVKARLDHIGAALASPSATPNSSPAPYEPSEAGDTWTWTGIDADSKLIVSWLVDGDAKIITKGTIIAAFKKSRMTTEKFQHGRVPLKNRIPGLITRDTTAPTRTVEIFVQSPSTTIVKFLNTPAPTALWRGSEIQC